MSGLMASTCGLMEVEAIAGAPNMCTVDGFSNPGTYAPRLHLQSIEQ